MPQGAVSSTMQTLRIVHVTHMVEAGAWFAVVGIAIGLAVMLWIRLRGWSWTCSLPMLVVAPYASVLGLRAVVGYGACAVAAVGTGASRHLVVLRAGGDLAQQSRDRVGALTPIRRWYGWRKLRTGHWVTSQGVAIGSPGGRIWFGCQSPAGGR